ncbi:MAG TPA: discoidin domain-containing protein, partial [Polyangiaceae bacterium]|nr:discoidin domain-containing protein [Polyangiaceae bacterium]
MFRVFRAGGTVSSIRLIHALNTVFSHELPSSLDLSWPSHAVVLLRPCVRPIALPVVLTRESQSFQLPLMLSFRRREIMCCGGLWALLACGSNPSDNSHRSATDAAANDSGQADSEGKDAATNDAGLPDSALTDTPAIDTEMPDTEGGNDVEQEPDAPPSPPGPVEYLGYFASAFDGHGSGDYSVDTAQAGANLTFIRAGLSTLGPKLTVAKTANQKAVVLVHDHLFDWTAGLSLRTDWKERWDAIASVVEDGHTDTVAAFYPIDEPYWNAHLNGVSNDTMKGWLVDIVTAIRERFPSKAVGTILAIDTLKKNLGSSYVGMFDWVGFDCYGPWDDCWGQSMSWYVDTLGTWLTDQQRMISVPEAFLWGTSGTDLSAQHTIVTRLNRWHAQILSDDRTIAVVPFYWPSMDLNGDGLTDTGAKDLPWIKERMAQMAASLLHPEQSRVFPTDEIASSSYSTSLPFAATDRNDNSSWNAGGYAPQWIAFDLGNTNPLQRIELLTIQDPSGNTVHVLEGSFDGASW